MNQPYDETDDIGTAVAKVAGITAAQWMTLILYATGYAVSDEPKYDDYSSAQLVILLLPQILLVGSGLFWASLSGWNLRELRVSRMLYRYLWLAVLVEAILVLSDHRYLSAINALFAN